MASNTWCYTVESSDTDIGVLLMKCMKTDTEVWVSIFAFRASLAVSISSKIKMKTLDSHRDTREEVLHLMFLPRGSNCEKHLPLDSVLF